MRVIKKNVYYCDYCSKKSLRSLVIHEKHCTANPNRTCRLCERESIKEIIDKYKKYFKVIETPFEEGFGFGNELKVKYLKKFTLKDIRNELEESCPTCLLAIIRCVGLNRYYFNKKFKLDYQKELADWWESFNALNWNR